MALTADQTLRETVDVLHADPKKRFKQPHAHSFLEQVQSQIGVLISPHIALSFDTNLKHTFQIPPSIQHPILRVLREAMTNITKHAQATAVQVHTHYSDGILLLAVEDNGRGVHPALKPDHIPRGLQSMHQLAAHLGGTWTFETLSSGTRMEFRVPVEEEAKI